VHLAKFQAIYTPPPKRKEIVKWEIEGEEVGKQRQGQRGTYLYIQSNKF